MAPKKETQDSSKENTLALSSEPASSSSCKSTSTKAPISSSASAPVSTSTSALASVPSSTSAPVSTSTSTSKSASTITSTSESAVMSTSTTTSTLSASITLTDQIPIKLEGMNYLDWNDEVEGVMKAHNLLGFVVKPVIPEKYASESDCTQEIETEEYRRWLVQDQMLQTWLLSCLSESIVPLVAECKHSWQVWDKVKERFRSHWRVRARQLRAQLRNIRKGNKPVSEYVGKIQTIVDSLADIGFPLSKTVHIEVVLRGLPREFKAIVNMTRTLQDLADVSINDVSTWMLILEENLAKENLAKEQRHADGGGGPSTQDDDDGPSCSPQCSTVEGPRRRRGHGRGGRRRGRN